MMIFINKMHTNQNHSLRANQSVSRVRLAVASMAETRRDNLIYALPETSFPLGREVLVARVSFINNW